MHCASCRSGNQREFTAEVMFDFGGPRNIHNPGVFVFPKVLVCLDCGYSRFSVPETELRLLEDGVSLSACLLSSSLTVRGMSPQSTADKLPAFKDCFHSI
jgi:hypothetical protein